MSRLEWQPIASHGFCHAGYWECFHDGERVAVLSFATGTAYCMHCRLEFAIDDETAVVEFGESHTPRGLCCCSELCADLTVHRLGLPERDTIPCPPPFDHGVSSTLTESAHAPAFEAAE